MGCAVAPQQVPFMPRANGKKPPLCRKCLSREEYYQEEGYDTILDWGDEYYSGEDENEYGGW